MEGSTSLRIQVVVAAALTLAMVGVAARGDQGAQAPADKALIARGDSVFRGKLGGAICATCHGQNAKGVSGLGPDLSDTLWLHGDGSVKFLETVIRAGVPKPKKSPVAMPPFGGVPLDSGKVAAVAAYVYSLRSAK